MPAKTTLTLQFKKESRQEEAGRKDGDGHSHVTVRRDHFNATGTDGTDSWRPH